MDAGTSVINEDLVDTKLAATSWYEFLLKPDLLFEHLSNANAVPGHHQLIIQFLQQANALEAGLNAGEAKNIEKDQPPNEGAIPIKDEANANKGPGLILGAKGDEIVEKQYFKKKIHALKLLALKIAAYGQWNLKALMSTIPGPLILQLLQLLMITSSGKLEESDEALIETLNQNDHSDHYFFSLLLYHRWCLQTVLQDCMPKKPTRTNSIPVPGLTEPVIQMVKIGEEKLAQIKKLFGKCKSTLTECLNLNRQVCIPTYECFDFTGSAMGEVKLSWEKGEIRQNESWSQQIAFDLGTVYFYETDYYKALDMFSNVQSNSSKSCLCGDIEPAVLAGYIKACQALVNQKKYAGNDINVFNTAVKEMNIQAVVDILHKNVKTRSLPSTAADSAVLLLNQVKEDTTKSLSEDLLMRLDCLCCVLHTMRGDPYHLSQPSTPALRTQRNNYLIDVLAVATENCSRTEKSYVTSFLTYLTSLEPQISALIADEQTLSGLLGSKLSSKPPNGTNMDRKAVTTPSLLEPQMYDVSETILAHTYNADKIWHLLCTLHSPAELKAVVDFWKLPKDLDKLFGELKMDLSSVCAYILIAKAKELILIKEYSQAVTLLEAAEKTIRAAAKIQKMIKWEILYCNLLSIKVDPGKHNPAEIDSAVKARLYALKIDSEVSSHDNLVMECVSYLLLSKDWEYLSSLHDTRVAYTEYARQLINVCKELPAVQFAKVPGKVLWDSSITIFSVQNVGKRIRLGNQAMLPKDSYKKFVLTINEPLVLSVLISLLTKVYSLKNTDAEIDRSNQFCSVWPESLSKNVLASLDESYLCELMLHLVQHALTINSMQSTWLKTYAEIQFALGNQKDALKYYLQSASVASNNFMQPIPYYVFDNEVYTRLVKCCVQLKRFTQAAVLSQFFDEPDYSAAFKYLQEKECHDGMDIYYDCLWDINIMEYLIYLHDKRGELDKKQQLIQLVSNPEINTNNPEPILQAFRSHRKSRFFRLIYKQYCYEMNSSSAPSIQRC